MPMISALKAADTHFSPIDIQNRPLGAKIVAIAVGCALLALSSYIEVPMVPVPITMQTLAVGLVGALYGWRLGTLTIIAWLVQGAVGIPVLAGGAAGAHHFIGPTAGYLFAFPIAGAAMGWLAEHGWNGKRPLLAFAGMLFSNGICLALGALWLATLVGLSEAVAVGVAPFLIGAFLKAALGAAVLRVIRIQPGRSH
jgi:biotin transport system substrate-specific component